MTTLQTAACGIWAACVFEAYAVAGWGGAAAAVAIGVLAVWKILSRKEKVDDTGTSR